MAVQPDLCPTWSETQKTGFLATRHAIISMFCQRQFQDVYTGIATVALFITFSINVLHAKRLRENCGIRMSLKIRESPKRKKRSSPQDKLIYSCNFYDCILTFVSVRASFCISLRVRVCTCLSSNGTASLVCGSALFITTDFYVVLHKYEGCPKSSHTLTLDIHIIYHFLHHMPQKSWPEDQWSY